MIALLSVVALALGGCGPAAVSGSAEISAEVSHDEGVELAPLMGQMQRHNTKLGFAIRGKNQPLASFYLEELHEVLEEIEAVPEHDGMLIGDPAKTILAPALAVLATTLEAPKWADAWEAYELTVDACNRCHFATEHGFIEILAARGTPPFNQVFVAPELRDETE